MGDRIHAPKRLPLHRVLGTIKGTYYYFTYSMMVRNFAIACVVVAVGFVGLQAIPVSALSIDDVQAQIAKLVQQISDLTTQLNALRSQSTPPTSIIDPNFISPPVHRVCNLLYRNLSQGVQGDDVRAMQEFLNEHGYLSASATGYFGPLTAAAVAKWQASEGVSAVGSGAPSSTTL